VTTASRSGEEVGRRPSVGLGVLILVLHGYFLWALGAAFGYDTIIYAQLGDALTSRGGLERFYAGPRYYVFQHIAPGVGLLWVTLSHLAGVHAWVVLALIQHLLAAGALLYFLTVLRSLLSRWLVVLAAVLVSFDPIYQSLHNTPMTESIIGSLLLIATGASIEALMSSRLRWQSLVVLGAAGLLGTQVRSQFALYVLLFLAVLACARREVGAWLKIGACALLLAAGALLWPVYRYAATGHAFLPNVDYLALEAALRHNLTPSAKALGVVRALPLPTGLSADGLVENGINYNDAARIGAHLRSVGYDDRAARAVLLRASRALQWDSPGVIGNETRLSLLSIGMKRVPFLGNPDKPIHRGFTVHGYLEHVRYWERWEAGTLWRDYRPEFERFLAGFRSDPELYDPEMVDELKRKLIGYFADHSMAIRDPLRMVGVPTEVWIAGWSGSLVYLGRRSAWLVVLLVFPVIANYAVNLSVPIGNPRYAYPLMPMYTIGSVIFLADTWKLLRHGGKEVVRERDNPAVSVE
jgi:hypothetical protein